MNSKPLDNLVEIGTLKKEPFEKGEFHGLVDSGRKRLIDANKDDLSSESRFDLAYSAAHAFALAAMRRHGYRPNNQRYVVFQAIPHTTGLPPEIWRVLDRCHRLRNSAEYEGSFEVNNQLLLDLLKAAKLLDEAIKKLEDT